MKILFKLSKLLIIITILNVNMHCSNEEIINSNDQRNDSDTKLQNQKPVRTESQNRYDLQGRIAQRFDEKGNKVEDYRYYPKGNIATKIILVYDKEGNRIEYNSYGYSTNGLLVSIQKFIGDGKGKSHSEGIPIENTTYKDDGTLRYKSTWKYDANGNMLEEYKYNSEGGFNKPGILDHKNTWVYDEEGHQIENSFYRGKNLDMKTTWEYDGEFKTEEKCHYSNGLLDFKQISKLKKVKCKEEFRSLNVAFNSYDLVEEKCYDKNGNKVDCNSKDWNLLSPH